MLALVAGAMLLLEPLRNADPIVIILSVFWLVEGLIEAIEVVVDRGRNRGWVPASWCSPSAPGSSP